MIAHDHERVRHRVGASEGIAEHRHDFVAESGEPGLATDGSADEVKCRPAGKVVVRACMRMLVEAGHRHRRLRHNSNKRDQSPALSALLATNPSPAEHCTVRYCRFLPPGTSIQNQEFHHAAQQRIGHGPAHPRIPHVIALLLVQLKAQAQKIDEEYTKKIKEYLQDSRISTELVDHPPASDKVPTACSWASWGAPGRPTYAKDIHRYLQAVDAA